MTGGSRVRTVVLVEDHALTRAGLRTALDASGDLCVVAEADDGPSGLAAIVAHQPDVAVIDLGLPGLDGIEVTRRARVESPRTRIAILTVQDLETEILAALAAGADAYSLKSSPPDRIVAAIRTAADGGAYFDPSIAHVVMGRIGTGRLASDADSPLSARETEILRMIAEGRGNAEIAASLYIGLGTGKGHVRDILDKLAAADRTQAAVTALRRGLI
ncbi:MAG: response regulator transcription factor [Candidatus Eremiobacteraeota bacterium]|nr:response regulator transcription factor [Candidatus Eremiobacteraeota bacterium]